MTTERLRTCLLAVFGAVLVVVCLDSTGVLSRDAEIVVDDVAQLSAGLVATVSCFWFARRVTGPERRWRQLMGLGMAGWSVGQAFWSYYQIFSDTPLPSPSWADVGYLVMPVLALPALLSLAVEPPPHAEDPLRHGSLVFFLDGLVVVGSLFILTWATSLGAVVHSVAPTVPAFAVAVAYPTTDLILVVIVVLLAVTQRVPRKLRGQLWLLGAGLVGFSASDSIFAYLVSTGAEEMPPLTNAGFIAGPLLVAVAAAASVYDTPAHRLSRPDRSRTVERAHLLLPYGLVTLTGTVIAVQSALGDRIDAVEASVAWIVLGLVLIRQMITLIQNTALIERFSAAQTELAYRAHHDPLTGLANRTLFGERLMGAMHRHRDHGRPFALILIDLDDFKSINDSLGHFAGDRLLHALGERLRGCVRGTDTVARLGGDEFAVVVDAVGETPALVSQRILASLRQPFRIDGRLLSLGASLGVVEPGPDEAGLTADVLLHRADGAMYAGKRRGKGIAVHYHPDLVRELATASLPERSLPEAVQAAVPELRS
jgi:diguanylate cyclase (GGDEF)-like protein